MSPLSSEDLLLSGFLQSTSRSTRDATIREQKQLGKKIISIALIDQTLVSGVNFVTGLFLARFLGMESYGLFVLLYGVILFISNIHNALLTTPLLVIGPQKGQREESDPYYKSAANHQYIFTLLTFFIIFLIGSLAEVAIDRSDATRYAVPLSCAASGFVLQEYYRKLFFSLQKPSEALANDCLSYGLQVALIVWFEYSYGITVESCLYLMAFTSYLAATHGFVRSRGLLDANDQRHEKWSITFRSHWEIGNWLLAKNVVYWLGTQLVIYATGIFLSVTAVGAMAAARNIVGIVSIFFLALDNFATPRASQILSSLGKRGLTLYLQKLTFAGGMVTGIIALLASVFPEHWLELIYGYEYSGYGWLVVAWSLFFFIGYFQRPAGIGLRVLKLTKKIFLGTLMGTITALTITYPLILFGGLHGAMVSLLITQIVITVLYLYSYHKR